MSNGGKVLVHPRGNPELSAVGIIALASQNGKSLCIGFGDKPPFVTGGFGVHPALGVTLFLYQDDDRWLEVFSGNEYEIGDVQ